MIYNTYYDKSESNFKSIREKIPGGYITSQGCDFYSDASTTRSLLKLSEKYIDKNFIKIDFIDDFKYAEKINIGNSFMGDYWAYKAIPYEGKPKEEIPGGNYIIDFLGLSKKEIEIALKQAEKEEDYESASKLKDLLDNIEKEDKNGKKSL